MVSNQGGGGIQVRQWTPPMMDKPINTKPTNRQMMDLNKKLSGSGLSAGLAKKTMM